MKKLLLLVLLLAIPFASHAAQLLPGTGKTGAPTQESSASDPLSRDTPSGTVLGFLQAAQAGNYKTAAEFLQISAVRRPSTGRDLANKLKVLMDRAFVGNMRRLSTRPEGGQDNGGNLDQQTIGVFFRRCGHPRLPGSSDRLQRRENMVVFG